MKNKGSRGWEVGGWRIEAEGEKIKRRKGEGRKADYV